MLVTVNFSENVFVNTASGTPSLQLNDGGAAIYTSGSGSSALTFSYTVGALGSGQNVADLALAATNALSLNGGTIIDAAGNAAVVTAANNYNPAGKLTVDTIAPIVTKVLSSVASGEVKTGGTIRVTLDTSEAVNVSGSPTLLLNDGGTASYDATHSTPTALAFDYSVAAGQVTTDLVVSGIQLPSTSSIEDLASNHANLSSAGANLGLQINTASTGQAGPSGGNFSISGVNELELFGPSTANVTFAGGSTGTLILDSSAAYSGTIAGFTGTGTGAPATSDKLDLRDINFSSPGFIESYANNVLTVSDGTHLANINFSGSYTPASFHFASDGSNGTLITDPPTTSNQSIVSAIPPIDAPITVADGSTVELASACASQVTFDGSIGTGVLQLDRSVDFTGTVAGMIGQDTLDLRDINYSKVQTPTFSNTDMNAPGTLSVTDGVHTANIALLTSYMAAAFVTSNDGYGGTSIQVHPEPVHMLVTTSHA